jgi:hypothetical protein
MPARVLKRRPLPLCLVVLVLLVGACSRGTGAGTRAETDDVTSPSASATAPSPSPTTQPDPDEAAPEPTEAPAPDDESRSRFAGRISPIPGPLAREMRGTTWHAGCPVPLSGLSLLRFNYLGFDGEIKRGPMVVNASVAEDVLWVFEQLFDAGFQLKRVGLAREFKESRLEEDPHTRRSVTASFNCRVVVTPAGAGSTFSQHSYGLAVDLNPLQNPYVREDGWVRNRFARPYVDRSRDLLGMIHDGDVVVRSFATIGWEWGGRWNSGKDYMHFSLLGR